MITRATLFSVVSLTAVTCALLFVVPQPVAAFFSNTETAPTQQFAASELQWLPAASPMNLVVPEVDAAVPFAIPVVTTALSIAAQYDVVVASAAGDVALCDSLTLHATAPSLAGYVAPATAFVAGPEALLGTWDFSVYRTAAVVAPDAHCTLTLVLTAWQENLTKGSGYGDVQVIELVIVHGGEAPLTLAEPMVAGMFVSESPDEPPVDPESEELPPLPMDESPEEPPESAEPPREEESAPLSPETESTETVDAPLSVSEESPNPAEAPRTEPAEEALPEPSEEIVEETPPEEPVAPPPTESEPPPVIKPESETEYDDI